MLCCYRCYLLGDWGRPPEHLGLGLSDNGQGTKALRIGQLGTKVVKTLTRVFKHEPARWLFQSFRQLPSPHKTEFTKP